MHPIRALLLAVVAVAALPSSVTAASAPRITIESPADGTDTAARTVVVTGASPSGKGPRYVERRLHVNGRRVDFSGHRDGSFRREVPLAVGRNVITAKALIFSSWRDRRPTVVTSAPVVITRTPVAGDATGMLDLATSFLITDGSADLYSLCGESDDCATRVRCFQVSATRVDCPTAWKEWQRGRWGPWQCGFVMSVNLRGELLYFGDYPCSGAWDPGPQRFVNPAIERTGKRFKVTLKGSPWLYKELGDANRYGLPRFDAERDAFIP